MILDVSFAWQEMENRLEATTRGSGALFREASNWIGLDGLELDGMQPVAF